MDFSNDDPIRLRNRLDPMNLSNGDLGFVPDTARLYIFTPRQLPQQILRSHQYNFTPDFIDEMSNSNNGLELLPNRFVRNGQPVICPIGNGIPVDLRTLNTMYSFVLIIDKAMGSRFNNMSANGGTRQLLIGFIVASEEPYNRLTLTVNPNAILNFTHSTMIRMLPEYGSNGMNNNLYLGNDTDYVNEMVAQQLPVDTYLMTPQDLVSSEVGQNGETINAADMCISNIKLSGVNGTSGQSKAVNSMLRSPVHHLSLICDALDSSVSQVRDAGAIKSNINLKSGWDDRDNAKSYFKSNVPGSSTLTPAQGLSPATPISINNLDMMFHGTLSIHPYDIPVDSQWDIYPQEIVTVKNVMSSFASMTLAAITPTCGLAHIVFRYASWIKGSVIETDTDRGWQIIDCSTIVNVINPNNQLAMLNNFKRLLEAQLFPTLKQVQGDFDIMAYVNIGGEVLVDLNFLDMNSSYKNVGFYETNARLGGMLSPMVADASVVANNSAALNSLADTFIDKDIGGMVPGFGSPTMQPNVNSYVNQGLQLR